MKPIILPVMLFFLNGVMAQRVELSFAKQLGGSQEDLAFSMTIDNLGHLYVTGWFSGTADLDPGPGVSFFTSSGARDVFVARFDMAGNLEWVNQIGGAGDDMGASIAVDASGNVVVTGFFSGTADFNPAGGSYLLNSFGGKDIFISKFSPAGTHLWSLQLGGASDDIGDGITVDASGFILSTGIFYGPADFDPGPALFALNTTGIYNNYVCRLKADGSFSWAIVTGGDGQGRLCIDTDNAGNVYVAGGFGGTYDFDPGPGTFFLNATGWEIYIAKYSPSGSLAWARAIQGSVLNAFSLSVSPASYVLVTGSFLNTADFDPGPGAYSMTSFGNYDIFVCRLDANGQFSWARQLGGGGLEEGLGITADQAENVYITGEFRSIGDYDPDTCRFILQPNGPSEIFITRLDADGHFVWAKSMGGPGDEAAYSISVNAAGDVFTAGYFTQTADFDPNSPVFTLSSAGSLDAFIHKLSPCQAHTGSTLHITSCGPVTLHCKTYTSSGTYEQLLENSAGCDSILTLNLVIGPYTTDSSQVYACNQYSWNGQTLTSSGTYRDTLITGTGCDSISILHLTILHPTSSTTAVTACNSYTWNGRTLSSSGTYRDTIVSNAACDSILILHLTILPGASSNTTVSTCQGYTWNGQTYASSGTYRDTLVASNGCDSIATLNLTILPQLRSEIRQNICAGQTFEGYDSTGVYTDRFTTPGGCDSLRTLHLIVTSPPAPDLGPDRQICPGDLLQLNPGAFSSYLWQNGSTDSLLAVSQPGLYAVTVTNNCGSGHDEVLLGTGPCEAWFPSAFTPNGDGRNDLFKCLGQVAPDEFRLLVYNRWGQLVFSGRNPGQGWDGRFRGEEQDSGVYTWHCQFKKRNSTIQVSQQGTLLLIR